MRCKMHGYQERALRWVLEKPRCGLFLDMGLGKSLITLTAIQELMDYGEVSRTLVVAPKKVAESTWSAEAEKWDHLGGLRVVRVMGTPRQRMQALATEADVYVLARDSFVWLVGQYRGVLPFDMMVIDELTSFKTPKSQRFKAMKIATPGMRRVVGLTGTPAPNGLIDLWAQMYCIDMGERLGKSVSKYRQAYFNTHEWNHIVVRCEAKKGAEESIRASIADICLSMQAKDYLELPGMTECRRMVSMSPKVAEGYNAFERERVLEFQREHGDEPGNIIAQSAAGLMNKLAQYANGAVYDAVGMVHEVHDEKLEGLAEIVEEARRGVLVFYQFRHDIARITRRLKGHRVVTYEGDEQLRAWNAGEIDVLLAHPASTAFGLNMQQGGNYIVWFGTGWNLELYQQANARLYRQGQKYPVMVYQLLCQGTVDERAADALAGKSSVQESLLESLKVLINKYEQL